MLRRVVMVGTIAAVLAACSGGDSTEDEYLVEINSVAPGFFVSDEAALDYVKNWCGGARIVADEIDEVVERYCDDLG